MRIGIDLGGTKIEIVALDDAGAELTRHRTPTPVGDYDGTIAAIVGLVAGVERDLGPAESVGIGTPGAISPTSGLLRNSNSTVLNGMPLDRDLTAALGRSITITNDANCFALSEAADGAGEGFGVVFGVILGTGVGAGVVVDGRALVGPNAIAGEWGHNRLDGEAGDRACYCGRVDCVERFLSGPALEREYAAAAGDDLSAAEIAATTGIDDVAATVMDRYLDRAARALAVVINIVDPDVIVLGGGMSNIGALYTGIPERWGAWVFSDSVTTPIRSAEHGDSSGVLGAARL